jgi:hypothetical protein
MNDVIKYVVQVEMVKISSNEVRVNVLFQIQDEISAPGMYVVIMVASKAT